MPDNNPCRYCVAPKRYPGCQDNCPDGIACRKEYHAQKDKTNDVRKEDHEVTGILIRKQRGKWR